MKKYDQGLFYMIVFCCFGVFSNTSFGQSEPVNTKISSLIKLKKVTTVKEASELKFATHIKVRKPIEVTFRGFTAGRFWSSQGSHTSYDGNLMITDYDIYNYKFVCEIFVRAEQEKLQNALRTKHLSLAIQPGLYRLNKRSERYFSSNPQAALLDDAEIFRNKPRNGSQRGENSYIQFETSNLEKAPQENREMHEIKPWEHIRQTKKVRFSANLEFKEVNAGPNSLSADGSVTFYCASRKFEPATAKEKFSFYNMSDFRSTVGDNILLLQETI